MGTSRRNLQTTLHISMVVSIAVLLSGFTTTTLDPDQSEIVTSDVTHFWQAFDDASKAPMEQRATIYAKEYFDVGSQGFKDVIAERKYTPEAFSSHVEQNRDYYTEIRPYIGQVVDQKPAIAAAFKRLKLIDPEIKFPAHIYFFVGAQRFLGTSFDDGIVFAAEQLATPPGTPYDYGKASPAIVPFVVVHETIHFNQAYQPDDNASLLPVATIEGMADFIASLVVQEPDVRQMTDRWQYGCPHEMELAARFAGDEDSTKLQPWLYDRHPDTGWPPDMGYWLGYRISQTYYSRSANKMLALKTLLQTTDFKALIKASAYPGMRTDCVPEKPVALEQSATTPQAK